MPPPVTDPLIRVNRSIFAFNECLYQIAVRPISRGYENAVPRVARRGLTNFFDNLRFPVRLVGSVLKGKFGRATRETGRFLANSTIGLGGFVRASDRIPALVPEPTDDLGQAFGFWGIGTGPYLILPLLGPSDVRDLLGRVGDTALTPTMWRFDHYREWQVRLAVQSTDAVQSTPDLLSDYDTFKANALDPYLGVRDAYLAHRAAQILR